MFEKQVAKKALKNNFGKPYLNYKTDLSHVKRNKSYQSLGGGLQFLIRDGKIHLRKLNEYGEIIKKEVQDFEGRIPMEFAVKCTKYCSDCGICKW
jgi:hypothetical protein